MCASLSRNIDSFRALEVAALGFYLIRPLALKRSRINPLR